VRLVAVAGVALALAACSGFGESDPEPAAAPAVYAAVVRTFLTGDFRSAPDGPVFVVEGELTYAQQAEVERELADLPPVEFVADRDSVLVDLDVCPRVRDDGAVITLGPIEGDSERVTVPGDLFEACLAAASGVFVVEREGDEWRVTGTEGPIGIS
jgi:hypothetical protein